jgi:hypothetical protein
MAQLHTISSKERVIDTMIELTRVSRDHRVIVAGTEKFDIYLSLHRRGFERAATTTTCRIPCGQHDIGLVAGWRSMLMLEGTISQLVHFLHPAAALAVWIDVPERARSHEISVLLERWGFRVEAGASCGDGFVLSARRRERLANAA